MIVGDFEVAIVGAGPAGSSLAIQLAERGRHVLLLEKETMPRDKLCGEFLSTEVSGMCANLGVLHTMQIRGARRISRARCTTPQGADLEVDLPGTALGLSRRAFDEILFRRASEVGVQTIDGAAVLDVEGTLENGFRIHTTPDKTFTASVVVGAYGRREVLDRKLERSSLQTQSPFVAFKAHFDGELPGGTIEVHTFSGGYCGVLLEEEGIVNVCWMVHRERLKEAGGSPEDLFDRMQEWSGPLGERLNLFEGREPYLAVGQLDFQRKELFARDVCLVGDAAGMIAPLCGDGMGMAMQTAEMAAPIIDRFLHGRIGPAEFRARYRKDWIRKFRRRMAAGRFLHTLFVRPRLFHPGLSLATRIPQLAEGIVTITRG